MSVNKKYYYMRLKENFFESEELVMLEAMPDGIYYSNILIKLYLKSLKNEGRLIFKDTIPYNAQMIATVTRHQIGTVEKALEMFEQLGLIDILDNGSFYMNDIELFVGKASTEAERKKAARMLNSKPVEELEYEETDKCRTNVHQRLEIRDKSIEIINKRTSSTRFSIGDEENSKFLFELMQQNNPGVKKPNLDKWSNTFRLIREKDKRTDKEIKYLINWTQQDAFWSTNILSPDKLRKQWDQLVMRIKNENSQGNKSNDKKESEIRQSYIDVNQDLMMLGE